MLRRLNIRWILSPPADASWNMAVDEALLWSVRQGQGDGILRFYRWEPPALSFGLFQRPEQIIDLKKTGVSCVRRMTGGKMVYHADEWTFSLICGPRILECYPTPGSSLLEMFKKVMSPFLAGLAECGLKTHFAQQISAAGHDRIHCYSATAGHSVFLGGKKLIGAAAVRKDGCLAIHGSIPISAGQFPCHLLLGGAGSQELPEMAMLSESMTAEAIARLPETVAKSYAASFPTDLQKDVLTAGEQQIAAFLAQEKFSDLFWPLRKDVVWDEKIRKLNVPG